MCCLTGAETHSNCCYYLVNKTAIKVNYAIVVVLYCIYFFFIHILLYHASSTMQIQTNPTK